MISLAALRSALAVGRVGIAYRWRHGCWPSLAEPRKFTEWVQWRKLYDRDPALARLTDKAHSKRIAAAALGDALIIPTLWQGRALPVAPPWPMPFIVKANHGCGQCVVVRTMADYKLARRTSPRWLERVYGRWLDEWHYRGAERSILVEPFIGTEQTLPIDYKVYVFGGRAVAVQIHEGRGGDHRWRQFDRNWHPVSSNAGRCEPPACLSLMLEAAERLAREKDFLRVDFYERAGRPLFGEFCLFPGSGLDPFDPPSIDSWLGAKWSAERGGQPKRVLAESLRPSPAR